MAKKDGPELLKAPRGGKADDLKKIKGLGPKMETSINELGIYHYDQIAGWGEAELAWIDDKLKIRARLEREDWPGQAKVLAAESEG